MSKRPTSSKLVDRKLKALTQRVSFLERALKPAKKAAPNPGQLNRTREHAEEAARSEAMREYYRKKWLDLCLRNPDFVARELASEREVADYLKARGLKPEPSRIPEQFHRGLKRYRPKPQLK